MVLVIILGVLFKGDTQTGTIKIGMIIPLSGPAADFGEQMKTGAEMAQKDLLAKGISVNLVFEDSKADPALGVTAYKRLVEVEKIDYLVSSFTRVTIPLIEMTVKDKLPMIMTTFAGDWDKTKSPYAIRFFPTPRQYARGDNYLNVLNDTKSASSIYVNDDYGKSVQKELEALLVEKGVTLLTKESYVPSSSDFRTQLTKIKQSNPEVLSIISSNAVETTNIIKQAKEMGLNATLYDASIALSNPSVYKNPSYNIEGVITKAVLADLKDKSPEVQAFYAEYMKNTNKEPYWSAFFGYEAIKLIAVIEKNGGRTNLAKAVMSIQPLKTLLGDITISNYQEINPTVLNAEIRSGSLVPVK